MSASASTQPGRGTRTAHAQHRHCTRTAHAQHSMPCPLHADLLFRTNLLTNLLTPRGRGGRRDPNPNPNPAPNQVEAGGATNFPRAGKLEQPRDFLDCTKGLPVRPAAHTLPCVGSPPHHPFFDHNHPDHTYPKTDGLRYSLALNHNSYPYPPTLLVLHPLTGAAGAAGRAHLLLDAAQRRVRPDVTARRLRRRTRRQVGRELLVLEPAAVG